MSRSMPLVVSVLLAAICFSLICLPYAQAAPPVNPFAGSWDGSFSTTLGTGGHITMHIAANGLITGHAIHYQSGVSGDLRGHINNNGFGFFVLRDQPDYVIPYLMYASIDTNGNLAVFAPTVGWPNFDASFVIAPQ